MKMLSKNEVVMTQDNSMYDSLAEDYDRFTNWTNRLNFELPFLESQIRNAAPRAIPSVLDAACGTGMHAIALARAGFICAGADLSSKMIDQARINAREAGLEVDFRTAGFGQLAQTFADRTFDALLCLGNSLPHLITPAALEGALGDFFQVMQPGGLLLLQSRNFDAVLSAHNRWMPPEAYSDGEHEWLFQRFYDFEPNGLIRFNMITLKRKLGGEWQSQVTSSMLYPQTEALVRSALVKAGFINIASLGSMTGESFNPQTSPNLVVTANKPG